MQKDSHFPPQPGAHDAPGRIPTWPPASHQAGGQTWL
eukprot:CAMPEP_0180643370 /NCGR_PEP_ID=MMETSP1037_2-20121125/47775_1 /TAXON_ID=632150 /ORGANISM="Azadinium spinosum, Strain 3D9" /LENGTH=36 /DNA_ID= /DNA_START= /DNA_END= /DNA_ORIENTATION=